MIYSLFSALNHWNFMNTLKYLFLVINSKWFEPESNILFNKLNKKTHHDYLAPPNFVSCKYNVALTFIQARFIFIYYQVWSEDQVALHGHTPSQVSFRHKFIHNSCKTFNFHMPPIHLRQHRCIQQQPQRDFQGIHMVRYRHLSSQGIRLMCVFP